MVSATGEDTEYVVGIDLGTTMTCAGVWKDGRVEILTNPEEGKKTTPSIIAFDPNNK